MISFKKMLFLTSFLTILGCSKTTFVIKDQNLKPFKEFSEFTSIKSQTREFQISQIIDNRKSQDSLGVARTGVKYKETPVTTSKQLDIFLKEYFSKELQRRGLFIQEEETPLKMTIRVNELWLEELSDKAPEVVKCRANFTFELYNNNKNWRLNFWNDIVSPGDLGDGTAKITPTLASCLNLINEKLVNSQKFLEAIQL